LIQRACLRFPPEWTRDYFFYANGFEKDFDFYAAMRLRWNHFPSTDWFLIPYEAGKEYPLDDEHFEISDGVQHAFGDPIACRGNLRYTYTAPK